MPDEIESIYEALPPHTGSGWYGPIHPFIGSAFSSSGPDALRVMAVGVNTYCDPWSSQPPRNYA